MLSNDQSYMRGIITYWGSGPIDRVHVHVIVDKNLQLVNPVLPLKVVGEYGELYHDAGINMQQGKILQYFMFSYLNDDDKNSVIVPYVFSPRLDILMYSVYHNKELKKEELKGLEKYELGILRNLIFAKYNYAFSSEFYQAYFNLYEFYDEVGSRTSRVKNVDDKLTETDKANIKCIRETETK
jgi:hypothetical protein